MIKRFEGRDALLVAAAVMLYSGYLCLGPDAGAPVSGFERKLAASRLAQVGMAAVKSEKRSRGIPMDRASDVNETGLIGVRFSRMTTTLGVLEAKRTSTHPDFAALAVELLERCGARDGDRIAVNLSGSFPALGIAVLSAARAMNLNSVVIASLGASMWGANDPAFTWLDVAQAVDDKTEIRAKMAAVSIGGAGDVGKEMDDETRAQLRAQIAASGIPFIEEAEMAKNIAQRMALYFSEGPPVCLVNIGGNLVSTGATGDHGSLRPGLVRPSPAAATRIGGLIGAFLERKVPVIHMLDLRAMALSSGLPYDPVPLPGPGTSEIFRPTRYARLPVILLLGAAACFLAAWVRLGRTRKSAAWTHPVGR